MRSLTKTLGGERVGNRPNRCEPRAVKRRRKEFAYLNEPRSIARARLLQNQAS